MKITIGIPKALLYYRQFPFWKTFFETLGAQVVVSPRTNSTILNRGLEAASSEICLPVKVFYGHALHLSSRCDYVFIPRIVSIEKDAFTCPKMLGLPDMIRALPKPPKVLTADFNAKKKRKYIRRALLSLAAPINNNPVVVYRAYRAALAEAKSFKKAQLNGHLTSDILASKAKKPVNNKEEIKIGVVGHHYNIYDSYISLNFLERLRRQKIKIETVENIGHEKIVDNLKSLPKEIFWTYEKEVVGGVMHWLNTKSVDGIIYLLSFACGPDSLIQVLLENEARKHEDTPLMSMVMDEHSGEAGFLTRLEAFTDMLRYKKTKSVAS
ncbi:MAG: hypothetical protein E3J54_03630 [Actinobacteria bacterium]|nr:MAG: hypothetical protein E3J54_03630 [Actinomycetota bacterium]